MDCVKCENFYFKEQELKFLLSGLGITEWYGLFSESDEKEWDKSDIYQILADLYQRNVIVCEENRVAVLSPFSGMLEILVKSKKCVTVCAELAEYPFKCCYVTSTDVVIMEKSQREYQTIRIRQITAEEWINLILKSIDQENLEMSLTLRSSKQDLVYEKIAYREEGVDGYLIIEKEDNQIKTAYREKLMIQKLREWIGGKE